MSSALCSPPLHHGGWLWELSSFPEETRPQKGVGPPWTGEPELPLVLKTMQSGGHLGTDYLEWEKGR